AALSFQGFMPALAQDPPSDSLNHPGDVALSKDVDDNWVYKSFPDFLPLYVFEGDDPNKSNCDRVCAAVWPLIQARETATPIGNWTIVEREDGRRQWAYKGRPVYTFFEDTPGNPRGIGKREGWYFEEADAELRRALPSD